jgi:hypothetical protein
MKTLRRAAAIAAFVIILLAASLIALDLLVDVVDRFIGDR